MTLYTANISESSTMQVSVIFMEGVITEKVRRKA